MTTIAFFNNKGGVGKTTLSYHLSWMYADLGMSVVVADLDPQANLTAMFLSEYRLEELWPDGDHPLSILGSISPIVRGLGDISEPHVEEVNDNLGLIVGDLGLSRCEARFSAAWPGCLDGDEAAFRTESAFYRTIVKAAQMREADVVLIDVGPNLGALNRAAIIAADFVVVPLAPDLFSLQGLRNLGPTLREWRKEWKDRVDRWPDGSSLSLPSANTTPAGYIVMQRAVLGWRPVQAYRKWLHRIPGVYRAEALGDADIAAVPDTDAVNDVNCLATLQNYRSLMPMAQEARKPIFHLKAADGALGGHIHAVQDCYDDFMRLATAIAAKCGLSL